jgi:hypothetical protein
MIVRVASHLASSGHPPTASPDQFFHRQFVIRSHRLRCLAAGWAISTALPQFDLSDGQFFDNRIRSRTKGLLRNI